MNRFISDTAVLTTSSFSISLRSFSYVSMQDECCVFFRITDIISDTESIESGDRLAGSSALAVITVS